jgi:hypothetical protein
MHVKTYRELLQGLLHCAAFWDGMLVAKEALKVFPKDAEILDYNDKLAQGFKDRHNILKDLPEALSVDGRGSFQTYG